MKSSAQGGIADLPHMKMSTEEEFNRTMESNTTTHEGMKKALNALLTVAKGANYCMFVVDRAWINFRYRKAKNNLHLQVAGNKYISPLRLKDSDIKYLAKLGIVPEEGSIDIFCREFDEKPRDLDKIVNVIIEIFNEVYHISDGTSAYIELDLAQGESEEVRKDIAQYFRSREGKQFKFSWSRRP